MTQTTNPLIDGRDFDDYERDLTAYLRGDLDPHRFVGIRLNLGIYAQRQEGMCMVRAKLPGGRLEPVQLLGFAEAAERFSGSDSVHITTRQDIQLHFVSLQRTAALQRHLAEYLIATREAGGNTLRNITGCPLAGACPAEQVDINPYIQMTARHFVRHPLTASLPRKFKISFSGCEQDCANGLVHDLAVIATRQEGRSGFRLLAGGGLGSKPREAILLEPFVAEAELLPAIEAVLAVHDKYSDRTRRMRSRIKFLLDRFGEEGFRGKFREEFRRTLAAFTTAAEPLAEWRRPDAAPDAGEIALRRPLRQRQTGRWMVPVQIPDGELTTQQLRGLAMLLERLGISELRTTQDQNLTLFHVAEPLLEELSGQLQALGLGLPEPGDRVISCPGTSTCPLGITASRRLAPRLSGGVADLAVRINGCQNACANANIADIGLYGKGRRHHGRLVPSYTLQLGGNGRDGGGLAVTGPDIPAVRVPSVLRAIHDSYLADRQQGEGFRGWVLRKGSAHFERLLDHLSRIGPMELPFLCRDHGDSGLFKVESQGVGECAGAQLSAPEKLLLEARYEADTASAFALKNKHSEAADCLERELQLSVRALCLAQGQTAEELASGRSTPTLPPEQRALLNEAEAALELFKDNPDELIYPLLRERIGAWQGIVGAQMERQERNSREDLQPHSGTHG